MQSTTWISTQRTHSFNENVAFKFRAILLNAASRYGMEREGICISFTIVNAAFTVCRGHFLQVDKRAGSQEPFDIYVCVHVPERESERERTGLLCLQASGHAVGH